MSSTGFLKWVWYLNWRDTEEFNRQDAYLAQIAAQIENGQVKKAVTIESKMLKWESTKKPKVVDKEAQIQRSKNHWMGITGMSRKGKLPKKQ